MLTDADCHPHVLVVFAEVSFSTTNLELALSGMFSVADPRLLQVPSH